MSRFRTLTTDPGFLQFLADEKRAELKKMRESQVLPIRGHRRPKENLKEMRKLRWDIRALRERAERAQSVSQREVVKVNQHGSVWDRLIRL